MFDSGAGSPTSTTEQTGRTADGVIERIQIDPDTGATAGRTLAAVESPFRYGEEVAIADRVEFLVDDAEAVPSAWRG